MGAVLGQASGTLRGAADPVGAAPLYADVLEAAAELLVPLPGRGGGAGAGAVGGPARRTRGESCYSVMLWDRTWGFSAA